MTSLRFKHLILPAMLFTGTLAYLVWASPFQQIPSKKGASRNEKIIPSTPQSQESPAVTPSDTATQTETHQTDIYQENTASTSTSLETSKGKIVQLAVQQQVQRAWNTCAPTTVSMLLSYKGITISQEQLAQEMETDETFGTHNANAIKVLNKQLFGYETPAAHQAGYRLETVTSAEQDKELFKKRLIQNISDDYPLYYTIELSKIDDSGKWGEHNVLGIGYQLNKEGTDIAAIYYLDPSYVSQDPVYGGLKKITVEQLLEATAVCVEPQYAW